MKVPITVFKKLPVIGVQMANISMEKARMLSQVSAALPECESLLPCQVDASSSQRSLLPWWEMPHFQPVSHSRPASSIFRSSPSSQEAWPLLLVEPQCGTVSGRGPQRTLSQELVGIIRSSGLGGALSAPHWEPYANCIVCSSPQGGRACTPLHLWKKQTPELGGELEDTVKLCLLTYVHTYCIYIKYEWQGSKRPTHASNIARLLLKNGQQKQEGKE